MALTIGNMLTVFSVIISLVLMLDPMNEISK